MDCCIFLSCSNALGKRWLNARASLPALADANRRNKKLDPARSQQSFMDGPYTEVRFRSTLHVLPFYVNGLFSSVSCPCCTHSSACVHTYMSTWSVTSYSDHTVCTNQPFGQGKHRSIDYQIIESTIEETRVTERS